MNCVALELKDSDGTIYKVDENIESSQLIINDDVISSICKKMKIKTLSQLSLKLGVNNMALIIKDYTLTDIVYIEEFYDIKSYISIFQTKDTNIHITGQTIQTLQADCNGGLVTFNLYSQRFIAPILQLVQFNNDLTTCNIAWNRLNNLLNTKIDVKNGTQTKTIQGNIKFEDVTFYYEEKKPVLHDVFMEFKKGEIYAIVGQSGAGKTTLMHLLFRLWDCISGSITVDGIDIKDFDIDCLRGQISIVSQNIFLLNDTIYNNIVLGKEITDEELQHILVQAGLHEFINTLPNKLETVVGENGIKLSGGEKQRISIARALLKKNPILIFDEATSMLDNETEEKIISILLDSFKDTTIILIAHRLSTVKNANTIYVLNNGTIMEHGNHDQLLEQKGIYYHLYNI